MNWTRFYNEYIKIQHCLVSVLQCIGVKIDEDGIESFICPFCQNPKSTAEIMYKEHGEYFMTWFECGMEGNAFEVLARYKKVNTYELLDMYCILGLCGPEEEYDDEISDY